MNPSDDALSKIEDCISKFLSEKCIPETHLAKAARYAVLSSAKRIRPKMILAIGGDSALDAAVAIELIHTYSLIHDDLPCMDDDDMRRGQPSLHVAYDEATSVLTGDFLLTYAFEILSASNYTAEIRCDLMKIISTAIGSDGMLGGQVQDIKAKSNAIDWDTYQMIVSKKTSALFIAALQCGAVIGGLESTQLAILTHFGEVFGLIFQIADDLKDDDLPSAKAILGEVRARDTLTMLLHNASHLLDLLQEPHPYLRECLNIYRVKHCIPS